MKSNNTVLVALFAALIVVLSLVPPIPLPAIPVPVTLQTLGAMLAGAMLGPVRGALACLLYLALAAIGLPVLPGGRGGMGAFLGPTGGFLIGMPIGAFVTGWLARRLAGRAPGTLGRRGGLCGRLRGRWHRGGVCLRRALAGLCRQDGPGQGGAGRGRVRARRSDQGGRGRLGGVARGARLAHAGPLRLAGGRMRTGNPQLTHGGFPVQVRH